MDTTELSNNNASSMLSDKQAALLGRELIRHLQAGAIISCGTGKCLELMEDGTVFGGLVIEYPSGLE